MATQTIASAESAPLRIGAREDFARVRDALNAADFTDATICRVMSITEMSHLGGGNIKEADLVTLSASQPEIVLFLRLFIIMESVSREEVENLLGTELVRSFLALDLLRIGEAGTLRERYYTPVFFYPVKHTFIASDRHDSPDGSEFEPPSDIVFPAIFAGTLNFLRLIGKSPAGDVLDLCSGSGIGALLLSRKATRAVASDVTPRAAHYATFNALMNDCANVEIVTGDLYATVEGRVFDRIIAHPPYMPALHDTTLWRDGGEVGEVLVQRIVAGLPQHLRAGGTAYILCLGIDTKDGQFEERARAWLGESADEFDVFSAYGEESTPQSVAESIVNRARGAEASDQARLEQAFERIGTLRLVYGALVIHRRAENHKSDPAWTTRVRISKETQGENLEWLLDWHRQQTREDFLEKLTTARPRLAPFLIVNVTHAVTDDGELVPARYMLEAVAPLISVMKVDGWIVPLITGFDGQRTVAEVHTMAREAKAIPDDFMLEDFARLVTMLTERCYLVIDDDKL